MSEQTFPSSAAEVYLSVVVPLFNEEENVGPLVEQLIASLAELGVSYEIILVDDGSSDATWDVIERTAHQAAQVRGIGFARNFGHQNALLAGLHAARGQAILSMDGDLQHPPSFIANMIEEHRKGSFVVNTCRDDAQVASWFKRTSSRYFYKIFSALTNVPMEPGASDFRLIDRVVLNEILKFGDADFLRGTIAWLGYPATTLNYTADRRYRGESKYSIAKMLQFATKAIVSFSAKPLILGIWIGLLTSLFAFLELMYVLVQYLRGVTIPGWASIVAVFSFLFGILFILLGVIGIYLSRIHSALQHRPPFVIRRTTERATSS